MAMYQYQALNQAGRAKSGALRAESLQQARRLLKEDGLFLLELEELDDAPAAPKGRASLSQLLPGGGQQKRLVEFTREMAMLLNASLPLEEALECCQETVGEGEMRTALVQVQDELRGGKSLSEALSGSTVFPEMYRSLIALGEGNGTLPTIMARLAETQERQQRFAGRIANASIYPASVVLIGLAGIVFLMVYVMPTITELFTEEQQLPLITRALMAVADFASSWWAVATVGALGVVVARIAAWRAANREAWDRRMLATPLGGLLALAAAGRLARSLALLIQSGTPVLESLEAAIPTTGNRHVESKLRACVAEIKNGRSVAETVAEVEEFPAIFRRLTRVGERTGTLGEVMKHCADYLEERLLERLEVLTQLLQPLLIVLIAGFIGLIAAAIFLPILELTGTF